MSGRAIVATFGLTHIALAVPDVERAFRFYEQVFGMVAVYRRPGFIQAQTPGRRDVLVLEESPSAPPAPAVLLLEGGGAGFP